jgi:small subunit ribosomal protein S9
MAEETIRYYQGTGRRKLAIARVRLYPGDGSIIVNDKSVEEYFGRKRDILHLAEPLEATATQDSFNVTVKVQGGGISGQSGAVRHGIARAYASQGWFLNP